MAPDSDRLAVTISSQPSGATGRRKSALANPATEFFTFVFLFAAWPSYEGGEKRTTAKKNRPNVMLLISSASLGVRSIRAAVAYRSFCYEQGCRKVCRKLTFGSFYAGKRILGLVYWTHRY